MRFIRLTKPAGEYTDTELAALGGRLFDETVPPEELAEDAGDEHQPDAAEAEEFPEAGQ